MKSKFFIALIIIAVIGLMFQSGCKTAWTFSIVGTWTFSITNGPAPNYTEPPFTQTLTFSGDEESGTFSGWTRYTTASGTYTISGSSLVITVQHPCTCGSTYTWTFNGSTPTEANQNTMGGNGNGSHIPPTDALWGLTWTATR